MQIVLSGSTNSGSPHSFQTETARELSAILDLIKTYPLSFRDDFLPWIEGNFFIWKRFEREANKVWDSGRKHYSARTLIEYIRHETSMSEGPNHKYKINNSFVPDIGRLYGMVYPQRERFFECRVITACSIRHQIRHDQPKQPIRQAQAFEYAQPSFA